MLHHKSLSGTTQSVVLVLVALWHTMSLSAQDAGGNVERPNAPAQVVEDSEIADEGVEGFGEAESEAGEAGDTSVKDGAVEISDSAYRRRVRDDVDASGPFDERAIRWLQQVETYMADERWDRAMEMLEYALDNGAGTLVRLQNGQLVPIATEVQRLFHLLPPDAVKTWRLQNEDVSEARLAEGIESGRLDLIQQVATQFRATPAGKEALLRLVLVHANRGEYALAGRWLRELDPQSVSVAMRERGARVWLAMQEPNQAEIWVASLPDEAKQRLAVGSSPDNSIEKVMAAFASRHRHVPRSIDHHVPFGSSLGYSISDPGVPLLIPRWQQPATSDVAQMSLIHRLNENVQKQFHAIIPVSVPLAVDDIVISRMGGRVTARNLADGSLLWESEFDSNALTPAIAREAPLPGLRAWRGINNRNMGRQHVNRFDSDNPGGPLATSLYRDGVEGLISSDQERVYVVTHPEDVPSRSTPQWMQPNQDQADSPTITNELHAYDIQSGRMAWNEFAGIGGEPGLEVFERPLAGYYFFGPPRPVGGELYVVAEKEGRIELISLDPVSGRKIWSRHIANAPYPLSQDVNRQAICAQVSISQGIIVCPTTVGWLVGIDQSSHSLLWAHRYAPVSSRQTIANARQNGMFGASGSSNSARPLDQTWAAAAPVIHRGRVLFTPAEDNHLECVNLVTGELEWHRGMGAHRYLAGIHDDCAVLVGIRKIEGINSRSGVSQWSVEIPMEYGNPIGRAVTSKDQILLPTTGGIVVVDLWQGQLASLVPLAENQNSLGNLLLHRGTLISQSAEGLTIYEEREHYIAAMENVDGGNPNQRLFSQARLDQAEGRLSTAIEALEQLSGSLEPDDPLWDSVRELHWDCLLALIESGIADHQDRLDELESIADTPDKQLTIRRLRASYHANRGEITAAVSIYMSLLTDPSDRMIAVDKSTNRTTRLKNWVAGQLLSLWEQATAAEREQIIAQIQAAWSKGVSQKDVNEQLRLMIAMPWAYKMLLTELERVPDDTTGFAALELDLIRIKSSATVLGDRDVLLDVYTQLQQLSSRAGLTSDAHYWKAQFARLNDSSGKTEANTQVLQPGDSWRNVRMARYRGRPQRQSRVEPTQPLNARLPFYMEREFGFDRSFERLEIVGTVNGTQNEDVSVPLRTRDMAAYSRPFAVGGHLLVLDFQHVVQAVSPIDGTVLWSWASEDARTGADARDRNPAMQVGYQFLQMALVTRRFRSAQPILAANAHVVFVQGQNKVYALDSKTGIIRWSRDRFGDEAQFIGTDQCIFVIPDRSNPQEVLALRNIDGKEIESTGVGILASQAVEVVENDFVTMKMGGSLGFFTGPNVTLSRVNPLSGKTAWTYGFRQDTLFHRGDDDVIYALSQDSGNLISVDPVSGHRQKLGEIPIDSVNGRNDIQLIADTSYIYVVVNSGDRYRVHYGAEFTSTWVNGDMFVFDRGKGELVWKKAISNMELVLQSFGSVPWLLFVTKSERLDRSQNGKTQVLAYDKGSGQVMVDESFFVTRGSVPQTFNFDVANRRIELGYSNERMVFEADTDVEGKSVEAPHPSGA